MKTTLASVAAVALVTVLLLGVRGTRSVHPPLELFADMARQPKYKPQGESPFFADGRADRQPQAGTVPWGSSAFSRDPRSVTAAADEYLAVKLPMAIDRALIQRGQGVFETYCSVCHGGNGYGDGITTAYGMLKPPSYHAERLRGLWVGDIFKTITEGKGQMGPYGDRIGAEDRWAVIAFIRALQRANHATLDDVPEPERARLRAERGPS